MDLIATLNIRVPHPGFYVIGCYIWWDRDTTSLKLLSGTQFCGLLNQMACGHFGLKPFRFSDIQVLAVPVCGRYDQKNFQHIASEARKRDSEIFSETNQITAILWTIFQIILLNKDCCILMQVSFKIVPTGYIDSRSKLVMIITLVLIMEIIQFRYDKFIQQVCL